MPGLPAVGTLKYNGYTFDGTAQVSVESSKVRDESVRTVLYVRHSITVSAVVCGGSGSLEGTGIDASDKMQSIHRALSADGGVLIFTDKGFHGDLKVNTGGVKDVKYGPKAEVLSWLPIGSNGAVKITWNVIVSVPECSTARYEGIMAWNYTAAFSIDTHGWTTRTVSGYLEIAQTVIAGTSAIDHTADEYRAWVGVSTPDGFKRSQTYTISEDKSRLEYSIVDEEIKSINAFPAGVVNIKATHRVTASHGLQVFTAARCTLSATITLAPNIAPIQSWLIFLSLLSQRTVAAVKAGHGVMLQSVEVEEDIYGATHTFNAVYKIMDLDIRNIIKSAGLWQTTGDEWGAHNKSLESIREPYGLAKMWCPSSSDRIVNLCKDATSPDLPWGSKKPYGVGPIAAVENKCPPPSKSYLKYYADIELRTREGSSYAVHQPLVDDETSIEGETIPKATASGGYKTKAPNSEDALIQKRTADAYSATFRGYCVRVGHKPVRPGVATIGSQTAVETRGSFKVTKLGDYYGCPVYRAEWSIEYDLLNSPGTVDPDQLVGT
tara:strand:- start:8147 stop:9796 length:1650 start_codon:yes stop_codon:yes gene_type:complete